MKSKLTPAIIREMMKVLGSVGGKAGTGDKKKRSDAHYARISALGVAARAKKRG